jgi:hypothetical protein
MSSANLVIERDDRMKLNYGKPVLRYYSGRGDEKKLPKVDKYTMSIERYHKKKRRKSKEITQGKYNELIFVSIVFIS